MLLRGHERRKNVAQGRKKVAHRRRSWAGYTRYTRGLPLASIVLSEEQLGQQEDSAGAESSSRGAAGYKRCLGEQRLPDSRVLLGSSARPVRRAQERTSSETHNERHVSVISVERGRGVTVL
jgi:hypothetical protein